MERRFGIIGNPVAHSQSPALFARAYPQHCGPGSPAGPREAGSEPANPLSGPRTGGSEPWSYDLIEADSFEKAWSIFADGPYEAVNVTAPFKQLAAAASDLRSAEVERTGAANILVKTPSGIKAFNSDYLGLKEFIAALGPLHTAIVIGYGGAGKAALAACEDSGLETGLIRHDGLVDAAAGQDGSSSRVEADLIIYTCTRAIPGLERLCARFVLEANYRDPALDHLTIPSPDGGVARYIGGRAWHLAQARAGFPLMTGEETVSTL